MTTKTDGGHAFPTQSWEYDGGDRVLQYQEPGMTLRDWFAAKALQGLLAAQIHGFNNDWFADGTFARMAYEMADAMLKVRENKS